MATVSGCLCTAPRRQSRFDGIQHGKRIHGAQNVASSHGRTIATFTLGRRDMEARLPRAARLRRPHAADPGLFPVARSVGCTPLPREKKWWASLPTLLQLQLQLAKQLREFHGAFHLCTVDYRSACKRSSNNPDPFLL